MNLLRIPGAGSLARSSWFPLAAQAALLAAFAGFIWGGWGVDAPDPAFAKVLRNTNLANLVVWSYWFPLVIVSAVLLGRAWCTVCPMELVTSAAARLGLRRPVPAWLRSGWVMTAFYAAILLVGVHTLGIHRVPHRMAVYLVVLLGAAVLTGLVFEKRAFCSYVCPVGHLLGLYARCAPLEWGAADRGVCEACRTKDCVAAANLYRTLRHSCTSGLYPAALANNHDCLLCTHCAKVCPNDNLRFSARRPLADFFRPFGLTAAQLGFIVVVSGFVVYEVLSEWPTSEGILLWAPNQVTAALGLAGPAANFAAAVTLFVAFPGALVLVFGAAARLAGGTAMAETARTFGILLLPTAAAGHVIKSALKTTSRLPYWGPALADPPGIETARQVVAKTAAVDPGLAQASQPYVTAVMVAALAAALAAVVGMLWRSPTVTAQRPAPRAVLAVGAVAYWAIFAVTVWYWRL